MQGKDREQVARILLAMTAVEAAVLDLLDTIEREREAMRQALEGDERRRE